MSYDAGSNTSMQEDRSQPKAVPCSLSPKRHSDPRRAIRSHQEPPGATTEESALFYRWSSFAVAPIRTESREYIRILRRMRWTQCYAFSTNKLGLQQARETQKVHYCMAVHHTNAAPIYVHARELLAGRRRKFRCRDGPEVPNMGRPPVSVHPIGKLAGPPHARLQN